jgi:hypothetical protein
MHRMDAYLAVRLLIVGIALAIILISILRRAAKAGKKSATGS